MTFIKKIVKDYILKNIMENLLEAKKLNIGYLEINKIAQKISTESNIRNIFDFEIILKKMGANIQQKEIQNIHNFMIVYEQNKFDITIPTNINKEFKRLLLSQALGHYILHAKSGKNPIIISSISKSETSKEGFWFALSLLVPDKEILSKFFRVPTFAIEAKCSIIDKIYFKEKEVV